jgi:DNA-binding MarR family transcriptional regulator
MSQILNKIEKLGLILRTPSETDKRKVYISLSAFGMEMVKKIKYDREEWLKSVIEKKLTPEDMELLAKALPALHKLIENK